jgi:hypothetical protein
MYNLVGIDEKLVSTKVLYPNPTNGKCTIELNGDVFKSLTVTDASGRLLQVQYYLSQNIIEIDLSDEINGLYFINLRTETENQVLKVSKR